MSGKTELYNRMISEGGSGGDEHSSFEYTVIQTLKSTIAEC